MSTTTSVALLPPAIIPSPDASFADGTRLFQGIPSLERAPSGKLWAAWYAGGPDQPWEGPGNYVVLVDSADCGLTWSEPQLVVHPNPDCRAFDPCLWLDPLGKLWLFWAQSQGGYDGRGGVWAIVSVAPDASSPCWSAPRRLCDGVMMNKPTVCRNGDWLLPVAFWEEGKTAGATPPGTVQPDGPRGSHLLRSQDNGVTFHLLPGPRVPEVAFDEHMVVERENGNLWLLVRTNYGIAEVISPDGGHSWQEPKPTHLSRISSRFFLRRLSSGHILLVSNQPPVGGERSHLTAQLSTDEGGTWEGGLILDERTGVSYPDGLQAPNGSISIIYDRNRKTDKEILIASFTEEDILAGEFTSTGARQRILVNRATGVPAAGEEV